MMKNTNPLVTSAEDPFVVGESDFAFFAEYSGRCECAAVMLCRAGAAEVIVDQFRDRLRRDSVVLLLPGSFLLFSDRSPDFRMTYCAFSPELFSEASFRMAPEFFYSVRCHPVTHPSPDVAEGLSAWFEVSAYTYRDRENLYRTTIIRNRLQNLLLDTWDKAQRFASKLYPVTGPVSRHAELFHRFVSLVHKHCNCERSVAFYADRLCVSARYLSTVAGEVAHTSPKRIIDHAVALEIKALLQSTDLSVQEIAYRLHFPDQSYLGRFFRKYAGESPSEFRRRRK